MEKAPDTLILSSNDSKPLYNGIEIPTGWNFEIDRYSTQPLDPPYLTTAAEGGYAPSTVNVDRGRQLFVDDFLIENTNLTRTYHRPTVCDAPVFYAEKPWETGSTATPVSGGVWYDEDEKLYKMWYSAGFCNRLAYATSQDGIHWERPALNPQGNNLILRDNVHVCSSTVWIDKAGDPAERYKLMFRLRDISVEPDHGASLYVSADGIHWSYKGRTGEMGDRSTFSHWI